MTLKNFQGLSTFKNNRIKWILLILIISVLSVPFIFNKACSKALMGKISSNNGEWIVVSVTNSNNKSDLWLINTENYERKKLISDRDAMITGKVNTAGDTLIYADAMGNNPWDVFSLHIPSKETQQITDDPLGQFNLQFSDEKGNIIFAKSGDKNSPVPQISKIDVNKKEGEILGLGSDFGVQDFDVRNNKIIALAFSYNEFITKKFKEKNDSAIINYSIMEMDTDGNNRKVLTQVKAARLDSISFSNSGDFIILGGEGIQGNDKGFYKLDVRKKKIDALLTEKQLKETDKIIQFSQPYIAGLSSDGKKIYFAAVPIGTSKKNILGMTVYPNAIYCYDLEEKKASEIFKIPDAFIPSVSFTYK